MASNVHFLFFLKIFGHYWPSTFNERKKRRSKKGLNISLYIPQMSHTGLKPLTARRWPDFDRSCTWSIWIITVQTWGCWICKHTHPSTAQHGDKEKQMQWRSTIALPLSDAWNSRLDILYQCMHEAELFLTEHGEDEVLGRVDLERSLIVILPLLVLAEFGDQAVELLYPGTGPEVQLRGLRDVFGAVRGGCGAVASWTSPAGERRRRHVREETAESKHRSARAVLGAGGREWCAHRTNGRRSADATEHWFVSLLDKHCLSK